ncbi:CBO0543 family protein [Alkalihalobacillus deserti]|uniref:CBO0543 family protein n=1 Tax=Alkalihalobacillus deserti TaxID=2879466 RepID=UPI001D157155|nr:CBO0543 family protein [Alkalihalobacillus deserti]
MNEYINIGPNVETFIFIGVISVSIIGLFLFMRLDWKRYGSLFLFSTIVGFILCFIFVKLGFYSYPYRLFPKLSSMPFMTIATSFSLLILVGVRYSPRSWPWKIPFYWAMIHIGIFFETLMLTETRIIAYGFKWDFWDSYTWWWIYLLTFEWIGGLIIPNHLRKPLKIRHLHYGKIGWFIIHFILIVSIFLGGYYLGSIQ